LDLHLVLPFFTTTLARESETWHGRVVAEKGYVDVAVALGAAQVEVVYLALPSEADRVPLDRFLMPFGKGALS
jgi:hypothetical protein